jgi:hypothetical protein
LGWRTPTEPAETASSSSWYFSSYKIAPRRWFHASVGTRRAHTERAAKSRY